MQQMTNTDSDSDNVEDNSYSFVLKSSLLSIWVPCVVGSRQTPRLFLISSVASLSAKLLMLGFVVIFIILNIKPYHNHSFLLCEQQSELERFNFSQICSFSNKNFSSCFSFDTSEKIFQKFRICNPDELKIQLYILGAVLFSSILSLFCGYKLHQIRTFDKLFRRSFELPYLGKIVHRSLFRELVKDGNVEALDGILSSGKMFGEQLNDPTSAGQTALRMLLEKNDLADLLEKMLNAGADPVRRVSGAEHPFVIVSGRGQHQYLEILLKADTVHHRCLIMKLSFFLQKVSHILVSLFLGQNYQFSY